MTDETDIRIRIILRERDAARTEAEQLRAELDTSRRLVTALLAGTESLRDKLEAADRLIEVLTEEVERRKQPEGLWYETVMKMLAAAPNHVNATFTMGERKVEITFYNDGGKTPGEVATELRAENEQLRTDLDAHRWVIGDSGILDGDNVRIKGLIFDALMRKGYKFRGPALKASTP